MILNILDTGEFAFLITDKSGKISKRLDKDDPRVELPPAAHFTIRQCNNTKANPLYYIWYFIKMYLFTIVRAFFLFRKKINEEISPIFLEAELECVKESDESTLIFEKSSLSSFDELFVAPKIVVDRAIKLVSLSYFADEDTIKLNRRKQFLRSISSPSMLFTIDALVFVYASIEELFNVCAFCLYLLPVIAALMLFMIIRAKSAYKKYIATLKNQVGYMNGEFKKID